VFTLQSVTDRLTVARSVGDYDAQAAERRLWLSLPARIDGT